MTDFKIIGDGNPIPTNELGKMTQGLGYDLRSVDPSSTEVAIKGDPVVVEDSNDLTARDFTIQEPTGLGLANQIQVKFGPAQPFRLDGDGTYHATQDGQFQFTFSFNARRNVNGGEAYLWLYSEVSGVKTGAQLFIIDNNKSYNNFSVTLNENLVIGDTVKIFIFRQNGENDDGGLMPASSGEIGIPDSPSAFLEVTNLVVA